jgi:hypothetical protein
MARTRRPWSKAKVRRVLESIHAGGFAAYRSSHGWNVWLSGSGAWPARRRFFLPEKSVSPHQPRWLGNRLVAALRHALSGLEGVQSITGTEAKELVHWCTRWSQHRPNKWTAPERAGVAKVRRWMKEAWRVPETVQGGQYTAERSRRGWVVRLSSYSGRLRGHYLVPFRALRPHSRDWHGGAFVASLVASLTSIEGAQATDDFRFGSPTWHTRGSARQMPMADS